MSLAAIHTAFAERLGAIGLPLRWADGIAAPPLASGGGLVPWILAQLLPAPRLLTLGDRATKAIARPGVLRAYVHLPAGADLAALYGACDAIAAALGEIRIAAADATIDTEAASTLSGDDIVKDLTGTYAVALVSIPFTAVEYGE